MKTILTIISGSYSTRFWPLSRKKYSKQYLPLASDNTILKEVIFLLEGLDNFTKGGKSTPIVGQKTGKNKTISRAVFRVIFHRKIIKKINNNPIDL
jgi:mannose-1-phosphate guanylyltransferase